MYIAVMFEFNYSVGDIRNSDLGEGIICSGEGSGGKGEGSGVRGRELGGKGEGSGGKGEGKWGMPTPLSTPSYIAVLNTQRTSILKISLIEKIYTYTGMSEK